MDNKSYSIQFLLVPGKTKCVGKSGISNLAQVCQKPFEKQESWSSEKSKKVRFFPRNASETKSWSEPPLVKIIVYNCNCVKLLKNCKKSTFARSAATKKCLFVENRFRRCPEIFLATEKKRFSFFCSIQLDRFRRLDVGLIWGLPTRGTSWCLRLLPATTMGLPSISVSFKEYFSYVQTTSVGKSPIPSTLALVTVFVSTRSLEEFIKKEAPYRASIAYLVSLQRLFIRWAAASIAASVQWHYLDQPLLEKPSLFWCPLIWLPVLLAPLLVYASNIIVLANIKLLQNVLQGCSSMFYPQLGSVKRSNSFY